MKRVTHGLGSSPVRMDKRQTTRQLATLVFSALVMAACEASTAPAEWLRSGRITIPSVVGTSISTDLGTLTGTFTVNAVLSGSRIETGRATTYAIDFGSGFSAITGVDYYFTFGNDRLDSGECLSFFAEYPGGFGVCNMSEPPQTARLLTFSCSDFPYVCEAFLDGKSSGELLAGPYAGPGSVSVDVASMTVTVRGTTSPTVLVDILPGSSANRINPGSHGVIPVAILTTSGFSALTVDPLSVRFGPSGASEAHQRGHVDDVDGDGDQDLVLHFRADETGIHCGTSSVSLSGLTASGLSINVTSSIETIGCK